MTNSPEVKNSEHQKKNRIGCLTVVGLVILFLVILNFFIPKSTPVETTQAPVIEALNNYKSVYGDYPDNLELLIPEFLKELPGCHDSTFTDNSVAKYLFDTKDGHYILICHNLGFSNTAYSSRDNKWIVLD